MTPQQLLDYIEHADMEQLQELLRMLRQRRRVPIHRLETEWGTTAEAILEAIYEAPDLIQRGVRGVLAEAIFRTVVVPRRLPAWTSQSVENDEAYDLLLTHPRWGAVRVQVKSQRKERQVPKIYRGLMGPPPVYVVETQRTRNGTLSDGSPSRPYRFNEFDVLAVCLHASSGSWEDFIFCAVGDLLPRRTNPEWLEVIQPIYLDRPQVWFSDFEALVAHKLPHL
jgi:hypothetical protein